MPPGPLSAEGSNGEADEPSFNAAQELAGLSPEQSQPRTYERLTTTAELSTLEIARIPAGFGVVHLGDDRMAVTNDTEDIEKLLNPATASQSSLAVETVSTEGVADAFQAAADNKFPEAMANQLRLQPPSIPDTMVLIKPRDPTAGSDTTIMMYEGSGTAEKPFEYAPSASQRNSPAEVENTLLAIAREASQGQQPLHLRLYPVDLRFVPDRAEGEESIPATNVKIEASATSSVPRNFADLDAEVQSGADLPGFEQRYYDDRIARPDEEIGPAHWAQQRNQVRLGSAAKWFGRTEAALIPRQN